MPQTSTGNCTLQVFVADGKFHLDVLLARLGTHTASWVRASLSQAGRQGQSGHTCGEQELRARHAPTDIHFYENYIFKAMFK